MMGPADIWEGLTQVLRFQDNIYFVGQPVSWALVSPGVSPIARPDGTRRPILHRPSIRLYKYSIYDGKVGKLSDDGILGKQPNQGKHGQC